MKKKNKVTKAPVVPATPIVEPKKEETPAPVVEAPKEEPLPPVKKKPKAQAKPEEVKEVKTKTDYKPGDKVTLSYKKDGKNKVTTGTLAHINRTLGQIHLKAGTGTSIHPYEGTKIEFTTKKNETPAPEPQMTKKDLKAEKKDKALTKKNTEVIVKKVTEKKDLMYLYPEEIAGDPDLMKKFRAEARRKSASFAKELEKKPKGIKGHNALKADFETWRKEIYSPSHLKNLASKG